MPYQPSIYHGLTGLFVDFNGLADLFATSTEALNTSWTRFDMQYYTILIVRRTKFYCIFLFYNVKFYLIYLLNLFFSDVFYILSYGRFTNKLSGRSSVVISFSINIATRFKKFIYCLSSLLALFWSID